MILEYKITIIRYMPIWSQIPSCTLSRIRAANHYRSRRLKPKWNRNRNRNNWHLVWVIRKHHRWWNKSRISRMSLGCYTGWNISGTKLLRLARGMRIEAWISLRVMLKMVRYSGILLWLYVFEVRVRNRLCG